MNTLNTYSKDIKVLYTPMDMETQTKLFNDYHETGSRIAYNKIYYSVLNFVISVAHKYKGRGVDLEDLVQAGNLSLDKAIKKFDHEQNIKFISYAVNWIRQSILEELASNSRFVKVTTAKANQMNNINKATEKLSQTLSRKPTLKEVAEEMKMQLKELELMQIMTPQQSLEDKVGDNMTVQDTLSDNNTSNPEDCESVSEKINDFIDSSSIKLEEHKNIIKSYFGLDTGIALDLKDLGERYHCSSENIRQIKNKSINLLKSFNKTQKRDNSLHLTPHMTS